MKFYTETVDALRERTDFVVDDFPLIWHKSDNAGALPDPERGPRRTYETALFAHRGDRKIVRAVANSVALPTARAERTHMSHKPPEVLTHFLRMLVDGSTRLLDPTAGSGSAIHVAKTLGATAGLGLEINEDFTKEARRGL